MTQLAETESRKKRGTYRVLQWVPLGVGVTTPEWLAVAQNGVLRTIRSNAFSPNDRPAGATCTTVMYIYMSRWGWELAQEKREAVESAGLWGSRIPQALE